MKHVLITGASSGIGRSTAKFLLDCGYLVTGISRGVGGLADLLEAFPEKCAHLPIDLTSLDSIGGALGGLDAVDGVVHSAGVVVNNPIKYFSLTKYQAVVTLNQTAPVVLMAELIKSKKLKAGSSVVFVSSINGPRVAIKGCTAYAASKCALLGISRVLALELAPRLIRVNTVSPGMVNTALVGGLSQLSENDLREDTKRYPLGGRYAEPSEIASVIEFLLSDRSAFITGQDLVVDGGYVVN